jgi:hypothetical protein
MSEQSPNYPVYIECNVTRMLQSFYTPIYFTHSLSGGDTCSLLSQPPSNDIAWTVDIYLPTDKDCKRLNVGLRRCGAGLHRCGLGLRRWGCSGPPPRMPLLSSCLREKDWSVSQQVRSLCSNSAEGASDLRLLGTCGAQWTQRRWGGLWLARPLACIPNTCSL